MKNPSWPKAFAFIGFAIFGLALAYYSTAIATAGVTAKILGSDRAGEALDRERGPHGGHRGGCGVRLPRARQPAPAHAPGLEAFSQLRRRSSIGDEFRRPERDHPDAQRSSGSRDDARMLPPTGLTPGAAQPPRASCGVTKRSSRSSHLKRGRVVGRPSRTPEISCTPSTTRRVGSSQCPRERR